MDQVRAGPAGEDIFEKQLPNCTATYSGYPDFAPKSPAKEKRERHSESLKRLLSALLSSSYYHLFPALSCPGKPVISPEASLEMGRRLLTPVSARGESALQRSQLFHLLRGKKEKGQVQAFHH